MYPSGKFLVVVSCLARAVLKIWTNAGTRGEVSEQGGGYIPIVASEHCITSSLTGKQRAALTCCSFLLR